MKHVYDLARLYSDRRIQGLFNKVGQVLKLELLYDRAGRSEGIAFVHYERRDDAVAAIREFNGANAKGTVDLPVPSPNYLS